MNAAAWVLGSALLLASAASAQPPAPLQVCMAEGNAPLSHRVNGEARGLDVTLAGAIAANLQRPLKVVFFETEYDRETTLAQELNALLSAGVCQLATGFAPFATDLGASSRASARTPDYDGAPPRRQRPFVVLGRLAASRAYYASAMGVVTREPALRVERLADLKGLRVGVITGTMAGSAVVLYRGGMLQAGLVTLSQRENLLEALEAGRFDATLTPLGKYDAYRLAHPGTRIVAAQFVHPLRMNIGLVGLEGEPALQVADRVIEAALADGSLTRWAGAAGATWVKPEPSSVNPPFSMGSLLSD